MLILPAIDLYEGKAVRLTRGDYLQIKVYSDDPPALLKIPISYISLRAIV